MKGTGKRETGKRVEGGKERNDRKLGREEGRREGKRRARGGRKGHTGGICASGTSSAVPPQQLHRNAFSGGDHWHKH